MIGLPPVENGSLSMDSHKHVKADSSVIPESTWPPERLVGVSESAFYE